MAQRKGSHVPKFASWGNGTEVPNYTVCFDKAREDRVGGKMINPNDPQENPDMFHGTITEPDQEPIRNEARAHERRGSRDDGEFMQVTESAARRAAGESAHKRPGGRGGGNGGRPSNSDRSPLHLQYQKAMEKGNASPGRESRMKQANQGDETPDRGAAVPKFGDWDDTNPESAADFTGQFQKVRDERYTPGHVGNRPSSYAKPRKLNTNDGENCCCFQWCRK